MLASKMKLMLHVPSIMASTLFDMADMVFALLLALKCVLFESRYFFLKNASFREKMSDIQTLNNLKYVPFLTKFSIDL